MSFYCKKCGLQSMNEQFEDNLCDECWDKVPGILKDTLWYKLGNINRQTKKLLVLIGAYKALSWIEEKLNSVIYKKDNRERSKWDY